MNTTKTTHKFDKKHVAKYVKPELVGGTKAPANLNWEVLLLSRHTRLMLNCLSHSRKLPTSDILASLLAFFAHHHKDEMDSAYMSYTNRYEATHE